MKLQVKFDFMCDLEKIIEEAPEEAVKEYEDDKEAFYKGAVKNLKTSLKSMINNSDYFWVENLDVKVVEK